MAKAKSVWLVIHPVMNRPNSWDKVQTVKEITVSRMVKTKPTKAALKDDIAIEVQIEVPDEVFQQYAPTLEVTIPAETVPKPAPVMDVTMPDGTKTRIRKPTKPLSAVGQ